MEGRRYNEGLHQAIEAKEGVKVEHESKTLATITFQNYFRLYKKLSGMTEILLQRKHLNFQKSTSLMLLKFQLTNRLQELTILTLFSKQNVENITM